MTTILRVKKLDGDNFTLTMHDSHLSKNDILAINNEGVVCQVVKVRKFTWWRKLLFRFGVPFHSMDLKQIPYKVGIDSFDGNSKSKGANL